MTKLRQRMIEELRLRNSFEETIRSYIDSVGRFARYYDKSPDRMNAEQVRSYLLYLLEERKLSWSAIHVNRAAFRFLYVRVLRQRWFDEEIQAPKRQPQLPTVLSAEEITQILYATRNLQHWTIMATLYATGMRCNELRLLKGEDIDRKRMLVQIRNGKGQTPRDVNLSPVLLERLCIYWRWRKPKDWLYPSKHRPDHPMESKSIRRLCANAGRRAGIQRRVHPHVFRHYATSRTMLSRRTEDWFGPCRTGGRAAQGANRYLGERVPFQALTVAGLATCIFYVERNQRMIRLLLLGSLLLIQPVAAQQASGKITGVVTDSTGAVIPGVAVSATNSQTGDTRRAETNASGVYVLSPLPVGDYNLEARKEGFKLLTREGIRIDVNAAPTIDLELGVGNVSERVNVTGQAATISSENQAIGNSRYEVQLKNLPTNVREVQALVGQTAGVPFGTTDTVGGNFAQGSRSAMQVVSDGAQLNPFQTTAWPAIDGIGRRADLTVPSTEAIAEVRWVSNGGSAESAQPTQVIIASKAGSNELHASAWEDYRSGGLGARRWEAAQRESFVRHQYGGTVGGPVKKDKMFFFGGIDVFSHTLGALVNGRQPTAAERTGDLSGLLQRTDAAGRPAPITLYDPLSGNPFPGNILPQNRLSPVATELLKLIPAAPNPAGNLSAFNAVIFKPEYDKSQKFDARWDYNLSTNDRLFARTTIGHLDQASRFSGSVPGAYGYSTKKEWTYATSANWTRIVNPSTVAVFQFTFRTEPFKNIPSGGDAAFNVPIVNLSPKAPFAGPPAILINSNGLGISDLFDRLLFNYSADYGYTFDPSITKTVHNHTIKAGFTFLRGYKTQELASPPYGRFQTTSDFNNPKSTTSATGDAYADFLLGYPSNTDVTVGPAGAFVSKTNYAAYIQDDWKITAKLTLNLGLRYDRFGFFEEMNKRSGKGDFALGKIVIQRGSEANIQEGFAQFSNLFVTSDQAGLPGTFVQPNNRDFTPRIGAAYRIRPTFVIRGGFGIYSVDVTHNVFADQYNQPPFIYRAQLTRSLLISQNVDVNSLFTFQNPTANSSLANATAALAAIGGFTDTYPTMKAYTGNVTVEKDLGHGASLRATYATNEGRNLSRAVQVNACVPGPVQCLSRVTNDPTGRRWTFFNTNFGQQAANGTSNFQSGEIEFIKRFSSGLLFDINYAHSRLLGLNATATNPVAAPTWRYDYGPNSAEPNDIVHWNFVWDVPVGKGRRFAGHMNRAADALLGGWMLSGLGTWQTGVPLTVAANNGTTPSGATSNRADRVGNGTLDTPTPQRWFDVTAYKLPGFLDASQARPVRLFGTTGIGTVYGPRLFSFDMTLQKGFDITERLKLRVRTQAYNIFNHPILGTPDLEVTSSTFGQIRASQTTGTGAAGYIPRSLQLGARIEF